ncbi:MAG: Hsp20/alpha crystallin family protein [Verrucomicrobia bacterium]|nr:Hsp20/alpha crystallin family protein [Verrucomicrobiota bacterium]
MNKNQKHPDAPIKSLNTGLGGILNGFTNLLEKLGDLAQTGESLSKSGEFRVGGAGGKEGKGIYGFSVKVGLDDEKVRIEPFGNIRKDEKSGDPVVQEVREPMVDVFDEKDHVLVVAEMPGISAKDVRLEVTDDLLTICAERGTHKYRKEVLLPRALPRERMTVACNNGVVEIKCVK